MRKLVFPLFIIEITVLLSLVSYLFRDSREAMIAIVDAQVTAISFEEPVVVSEIQVVAGQKVKKGQVLLNVENPQLALKINRYEAEIAMLGQELKAEEQKAKNQEQLLGIKYKQQAGEDKARLELIDLKISQSRSMSQKLALLGGDSISSELSLLLVQKESILKSLDQKRSVYQSELRAIRSQLSSNQELLQSQWQLKQVELKKALDDQSQLVRYASLDGTVGTVNVQLGELTPPFSKLVTIYESKPSLIKAYLNERITYEVSVGDSVNVLSENRSYQTSGVVIEIGNRIAPFPEKIDLDPLTRNYGQEVFIRISPENTFLNGEKVFVTPKK